MDELTATLASAIGGRVRAERLSRRWTLDRLAEESEVSRRMVVSVEQGTVNPSVGTLLRLSAALGVGLPSLVEAPELRSVTVTRAGRGAVLWTGDNGGRGVLIASGGSPEVELWDWVLGPGDRHAGDAHTPGTWELLHVLDGELTVEVADRTLSLRAGDAASFPGDAPHAYVNGTTVPARFSLAVIDPGASPTVRGGVTGA